MSKYCTCMPKARASRATFLPMVPKPMMPSVLSCSSYMRGAGPLPRQRPPDTLPCCQTTLRQTVSISINACSDTEIAFAPPLFESGTLARRAASRSTLS